MPSSSLQGIDIGNPTIAGSTTTSGATYTIRAAGSDIWNNADQFHFAYRVVSGDLDVSVRVASLTNTDAWAKAGVMIRRG